MPKGKPEPPRLPRPAGLLHRTLTGEPLTLEDWDRIYWMLLAFQKGVEAVVQTARLRAEQEKPA